MYNGKKIIALIPARGGSKSIPKKNIANLGGKPLIAWSIEVAKSLNIIDEILVSTDSDEIAEVALQFGSRVHMRPSELASDKALVIDTIKFVVSFLKNESVINENDYLMLLEPTCPFRSKLDLLNCIELIDGKNLDTVATYKEAELNPYRAWKIEDGNAETFIENVNPWLPRQELPQAFQLNGAVYIMKIGSLKDSQHQVVFGKSGAIIMPKERSIDIDNPIDLVVAEALINEKQ